MMYATMMTAAVNPSLQWTITAEEKQNYDLQFDKMIPQNGFVTGSQTRNFFLQSSLPAQVLGQIWCLADFTNDGKMDRVEFAIAMKLIKLTLQGITLPPALPPSMKIISPGAGVIPVLASSMGSNQSLTSNGSNGTSDNSTISRNNSLKDVTRSSSQEWGIPKQVKLKYNQFFNANDRAKSGFLTGVQARHLLSGTGLPQMTLAQIWQLSDLDKDGKLTQEEFVIAMHLTDTVKAGNTLPAVLPPQYLPPSLRSTPPIGGGQSGLVVPLGTLATALDAIALNKDSVFASFEDKRRENFQKGNLELEKRRQALVEKEQKERERKEQKLRDERERREKERLEQERKKQEEAQRQLELQIQAEREREEHRRRAQEQKEAAQREMERQRQLEWERTRRKELLQQKLREQDSVTSLRARTKTLDVELQSLEEKKEQLISREMDIGRRKMEEEQQLVVVTQQRDAMQMILHERQHQLELMKCEVGKLIPTKLELSERLEYKPSGQDKGQLHLLERDVENHKSRVQLLTTDQQATQSRKIAAEEELERIYTQLNLMRSELNKMELEGDNLKRVQQDKSRQLEQVRHHQMRRYSAQRKLKDAAMLEELAQAQKANAEKDERLKLEAEERMKREEDAKKKKAEEEAEVRRKIAEMQIERKKQKQQQQPITTNGQQQPPTQPSSASFKFKISQDPAHLVAYRALYNFVARNPDELSLQVDDIVTVDESQDAEPDWLAGSKDGKAGWFPANYVRKVKEFNNNRPVTTVVVTSSPSAEAPTITKAPPARPNPMITSSQTSAFLPPTSTTSNITASNQPIVQLQLPVPSQSRYRALYPWIAKKDNHLSFEKDDVIMVTEMQEMWWYGQCKGKTGWFPKSYVKELQSTTPVMGNPPASPKTSPMVKRKAPLPPVAAARTKSLQPPPPTAHEYVASYDFAGTEQGDLSFVAGDVILVVSTDGEWWRGTLKGENGIFPANYVTKKPAEQQQTPNKLQVAPPPTASIPAPSSPHPPSTPQDNSGARKPEVIAMVIAAYEATSNEQLSLTVGQLISVRKKSDRGWWEGVLQARGKKRQSGWFPANYVKLMANNNRASPSLVNASPSVTPTIEEKYQQNRVSAMYDYQAQNRDELSFKQGQIIIVHDRTDADWWRGALESEDNSNSGLFPSNYVNVAVTQQSRKDASRNGGGFVGGEYHQRVMELINSEQTYLKDLELADHEFQQPLRKTKLLSDDEIQTLFVNLNELVMCSAKLVRAFRVRCAMTSQEPLMIGDILCEQISNLHPYIRFCSCQLNASTFLQEKLDTSADFKAFVKSRESGDQWKGLPVSSYLVKPMQRVTKYPLLIKKILEHTPEHLPGRSDLTTALEKAEVLCHQVNEGVRHKENSERLEWIQNHVQLESLNETLVFNSNTNCLGQRHFIHCGILCKYKSNKELVCFLFNDFLLLTTSLKPLNNTPVNDLMFSSKNNLQFRIYKEPVFLNEVLTRLPSAEGSGDEAVFHLSHIESIHMFRTETINERSAWMKKISNATAHYIETEKKKREKAYQARTQRCAGVGRLMVTIVEGCNLMKTNNIRHHPYCQVTMGDQCHATKTVQETLNPKWGSTMQFFVANIDVDVLCISIYQRDMFSPDDFLGRTEVKLVDVDREMKQQQQRKGPITKRLLLHQVDAGEVIVKLDLLLFEPNIMSS